MDWMTVVIIIMFFVYVIADRVQERRRTKIMKVDQLNKYLCADLGFSFGKRGLLRGDLYYQLESIIGKNEEAKKIFHSSDIWENHREKVQSDSDVVH